MLEVNSALGETAPFEMMGLRLSEASDFTLTQLVGEEKDLKKSFGKLPNFGAAITSEDRTAFRVGPSQIWIVGDVPASKNCFVTPLSSGRARFLLEGGKARGLLASCAAIDFSVAKFGVGAVAMTGIHHTPVLIHCGGENSFHLYVMRSFALSTWEWLTDAAIGLGA